MAFKFDEVFKNILLSDILESNTPLLLGEPGIGKTSYLKSFEEILNTRVFIFPVNQMADKADITGARLLPRDDTYVQMFFPHQIIQDAIDYALAHPDETPILLLDEINRTTPDVTSECLSLPTLRAIGSQALPDNLRIVCAGNDKGNVTALDEASISRFSVYYVAPDVDTFCAVNAELNPHIKNVLTRNPETLLCKRIPAVVNAPDADDENASVFVEELFDEVDGIQQITTPRTITGLSKWMNKQSDAELRDMLGTVIKNENGDPSNVLEEVLISHVGNTEFKLLLMTELTTQITLNATSPTAQIQLTQPAAWSALKAAKDMTEINNIVVDMSNQDRSAAILCALEDKMSDNSAMLKVLAPSIQQLEKDDMVTLVNLLQANRLSQVNIQTFMQTGSTLAKSTQAVIEAFGG